MRIFGGERLKGMMERLGLSDDQPIEHRMISRSIESAQHRVEGHNFDIRKHLVEYDDVMNKQREVLYRKRRRILMLDVERDSFLSEEILSKMAEEERAQYENSSKNIDKKILHELERRVCLSVIDQLWVEHLNTMDHLRVAIGLRGYGQVDPLVVYKEESFRLFEGLLRAIDDETISILLKIEFEKTQAPAQSSPEQNLVLTGADTAAGSEAIEEAADAQTTAVIESPSALPEKSESEIIPEQPKRSGDVVTFVRSVGDKMESALGVREKPVSGNQKVGRNDPCPCGSGKKFKKCHGR